ncbi:MAG TPA: succinate dehydrogenase iron-sulfur subunit [Anaerolineaceae bacterium]|nr:MAG: succinate dehydrogenase iron-sulfur subunit [Chloroflexi bacterium GWB2_54_36]HAL16971.1 succinate dehydrogenase iron-sulfur subunit [Anaerolineaceae bacterium]HBA92706.1 succinate dehydrogenase iron-sulfur subunit [Anaerolineaceae bacterium]
MEIRLRVFRFQPEKDQRPRYDVFTIETDPTERILDLLEYVRGDVDGSLAFRRSCAHGVCGSDAMRINGRNLLACKVLVKDLGTSEITVEPLLGLRVIKDLIVDMGPFLEHYKSVMPYFINDDIPADGKEFLQSPEQRARFDDTTKCIMCAACTTSCPSFWSNTEYVGPAAIVNAHRFIFDSRDTGAAKRLEVLNEQFGVWRCRTAFNCTEACPREIKITQAIAEVKQVLTSGKLE